MTEKRKYVGHCIYCNSTNDLTDEHAAPAGLMGEHILEKASCKTHRDLTSYIERVVLRGLFGPVRAHYGYGSKRHKKRPDLTVALESDDGSIEKIALPVFTHPYHLTMPVFEPPGILVGRQRNQGFPSTIQSVTHTHDAARRKMRAIIAMDPRGRRPVVSIDAGNLSKFLAKVGYCFAHFFFGDDFNSLVLELILADRGDSILGPYFVGNSAMKIAAERDFDVSVRVQDVAGIVFVVTRLHLFTGRDMPAYDIVVGTTTADSARERLSKNPQGAVLAP